MGFEIEGSTSRAALPKALRHAHALLDAIGLKSYMRLSKITAIALAGRYSRSVGHLTSWWSCSSPTLRARRLESRTKPKAVGVHWSPMSRICARVQ